MHRMTTRWQMHSRAPPLSVDMKPIEGIVVAIKKELEAMQMYSQLAKLATGHRNQFALFPAGKHGTGPQGTT